MTYNINKSKVLAVQTRVQEKLGRPFPASSYSRYISWSDHWVMLTHRTGRRALILLDNMVFGKQPHSAQMSVSMGFC